MSAPLSLSDSFSGALGELSVRPGIALAGLPPVAVPLVLSHFSSSVNSPVLASFQSVEDALTCRDVLVTLSRDLGVALYPGDADLSASPPGFYAPLEGFRIDALAQLVAESPPRWVLFPADVLQQGLPSAGSVRSGALEVRPGDVSYSQLRLWLAENGYEAVSLVTEPGTYALRGSIIDCYPPNCEFPLRLDFLDELLEEIRLFDIHSQVSTERAGPAVLVSLDWDSSGRVPIFDYFPDGWLLAHQEEDNQWAVTSNSESLSGQIIDLRIEPFADRGVTPEIILARWDLVLRNNSSARAIFVGGQPSLAERARALLPNIDLQQLAGYYPRGFSSLTLGLLVLTPSEFLPRPVTSWRPLKRGVPSLSTVQRHIEALEPGDPVVHVHYGIGRYQGLTQLDVGGTTQESLTIEYQDGDKVHVSTDKISLVLPYTAGEGRQLQLDSLRSSRWERIKQKTQRSAEEVVDQLAELYSLRSTAQGISHIIDDELQNDMERSFPYDDTPDQVRSTEEIKRDMELARPMDRLLCGDVGFGKTELALRASFKAIRGGYQVALMAPTTILVDQHFISFRARLEPFAVSVKMLSRFVSPAQQRQVLEGISAGAVDLLVGTHRLISADVSFRRLGLLIIDEEHRFGVRQKERIKELKASVDVLCLSATPIPRTLHFSLAGIRDISRLDTPPLERIPIYTTVHYFSRDVIKKAVDKEIKRGGQVFFVHHEVKSIDVLARDLAELLPGVSIGVAHGQMRSKDLEATMLSFSEGSFQLLVCTSIIESGIDLPNVNTVIINNAHRFGLAQLYQIRGRVGRSNRQAYAHLLLPRRPRPTREALKRLKTLVRHTALGSGYAIALKDLEIRGTGNLFGLEQSGHVAAVGLDLYTRIIQGIARERNLIPDSGGTRFLDLEDVVVRIFPRARIPEAYVYDPHLRLGLYRRLSMISNHEELVRFQQELADRFGPPPEELVALLRTAELRILASRVGVRNASLSADGLLRIDFVQTADPALLIQSIRSFLEPLTRDYRFLKLKQGALRLSFPVDRADVFQTLTALIHALDSGETLLNSTSHQSLG